VSRGPTGPEAHATWCGTGARRHRRTGL